MLQREFSEKKKRLGEMEQLLSLNQSMETQRKPGVAPEALQMNIQFGQVIKKKRSVKRLQLSEPCILKQEQPKIPILAISKRSKQSEKDEDDKNFS